jgi:hypothetical protein
MIAFAAGSLAGHYHGLGQGDRLRELTVRLQGIYPAEAEALKLQYAGDLKPAVIPPPPPLLGFVRQLRTDALGAAASALQRALAPPAPAAFSNSCVGSMAIALSMRCQLPGLMRLQLLQYLQHKSAGAYDGHVAPC